MCPLDLARRERRACACEEAAGYLSMAATLLQAALSESIFSQADCVVVGEEQAVAWARTTADLDAAFDGRVQSALSLTDLDDILARRRGAELPSSLCMVYLVNEYARGASTASSQSSSSMSSAISQSQVQNVILGHSFVMFAHFCRQGQNRGLALGNERKHCDNVFPQLCVAPDRRSIAKAIESYTESHLSCSGMMSDELMDDPEYRQEILMAVDEELESVEHLQVLEQPDPDKPKQTLGSTDLRHLTDMWNSAHTIKTTTHMISATKLEALSTKVCETLRTVVRCGGDISGLDARQVWAQSVAYLSAAHTLRKILLCAASILEN